MGIYNDDQIDKEIDEKGLEAPRLNPIHIDSIIKKAEYHKVTEVLTICVLTLKNGFTVTGESACASPINYDKELGEKISFDNARDKIWVLEGYLLKEILFLGDYGFKP